MSSMYLMLSLFSESAGAMKGKNLKLDDGRHADVIALRLRNHVRIDGQCWVTAALST